MPRRDIEFKTIDNVTLRGWFYTPEGNNDGRTLPCLVMAHGWSAVKEMYLDTYAEYFISKLAINVLVYDNRGFGDSDAKDGCPRLEIVPAEQRSDYSDAITYAQTLLEVDKGKIAIWGTSYAGGHVLYVAAVDRRVKAVLSQVPLVNGWETVNRLVRSDMHAQFAAIFEGDRHNRMAGKEAGTIPVVDENPMAAVALPTEGSYAFLSPWEKKSSWKNSITIRSVELIRGNVPGDFAHRIAPTPLLLTVAENDTLCSTDLSLEAYANAREPKELHILPGGHFDAYTGAQFVEAVSRQAEFLSKHLL